MTSDPAVLDRLSKLVRDNYVFPDVAAEIVDSLGGASLAGTPDDVAAECTTRMQAVNQDRHLRVRRRRATQSRGESDWATHYAADAARNAGGVRAVSRPDARTGLIEIAPYMSPVHLAQPYVVAGFALLTGVERLVNDVRAGVGGTPETVALICGYLLGDEPVHLQDIVERDGTARQFWTSPAAGRLPDAVPIAVLASEQTFSGAEELAYDLQALGRATVFGAQTAGGAHPVDVFDLTETLEVAVPVARSVNAVTGTNWEQTGIVPDVACPPHQALERALQSFEMPVRR